MSIPCQLWLTIAAEGKCTLAEIRSIHPTVNNKSLISTLQWMKRHELVKRFPGDPATYGVVSTSVMPAGLRVDQAFAALGVK